MRYYVQFRHARGWATVGSSRFYLLATLIAKYKKWKCPINRQWRVLGA